LGWEFLQRKTYDGEPITTMMDLTFAREGSLDVVSPSESFKDRADVGLMIEDLLTGHMPRHG
jgi:hypothetical protein